MISAGVWCSRTSCRRCKARRWSNSSCAPCLRRLLVQKPSPRPTCRGPSALLVALSIVLRCFNSRHITCCHRYLPLATVPFRPSKKAGADYLPLSISLFLTISFNYITYFYLGSIERKRKKKVEGVAEAKSKTPRYTNNWLLESWILLPLPPLCVQDPLKKTRW